MIARKIRHSAQAGIVPGFFPGHETASIKWVSLCDVYVNMVKMNGMNPKDFFHFDVAL